MTLTLRPRGRGNWRVMTMHVDAERGGLVILVGHLLTLGGIVWRITKVEP